MRQQVELEIGDTQGFENTGAVSHQGRSHPWPDRILQIHSGEDISFYLFIPSGILGVIEIIYHLMWADGLIKLNQKTFAVALCV